MKNGGDDFMSFIQGAQHMAAVDDSYCGNSTTDAKKLKAVLLLMNEEVKFKV